jgi:hypothetical protein
LFAPAPRPGRQALQLFERDTDTTQARIADASLWLVCVVEAELSDKPCKCCTRIPFNRHAGMRLETFTPLDCQTFLGNPLASFNTPRSHASPARVSMRM